MDQKLEIAGRRSEKGPAAELEQGLEGGPEEGLEEEPEEGLSEEPEGEPADKLADFNQVTRVTKSLAKS